MTTTERAQVIRQELKRKHGWNSRDVSVKADYYSMGSAIRVRIKRADVDLKTVKAIAESHESIDLDQFGEILSGGNRYVTVGYSHEACDALRESVIGVVEKAVATLATSSGNSLIDIEGTPYMVGKDSNGYGLTVWKHDADGSGHHCCNAMIAKDVALYVAIGSWNQ